MYVVSIVVDPTDLKEGLHYSEVVGINSEAPWRGPLFRIPVTICKPLELKTSPPVASFSDLSFVPGTIYQQVALCCHFIAVSNWSLFKPSAYLTTQ